MFSTEKGIRKPPFELEREQNRRMLRHGAHLQEQCSGFSQTAARTDGENMGRSRRRNSLQMQKPDLCSIPGKNNKRCRVQWGARGAPVQVTAPPPPIQRRPIKSAGFQLVKGITGQCFSSWWISALALFATHFELCLREKAGRRGLLPTRRSGIPVGEQAFSGSRLGTRASI